MRRPRRLPAAAAVLAVALSLAVTACSGGRQASGTPRDCPAAPGISPKAVNYGLLYPTTGTNSQTFVPYRAGIDARLAVENAKGGVYGRQIHYTWTDDGNHANTNLVNAQRLVNHDKVFLVQEFSSSPQGSADWLNRQGVPVVGTANSEVWARYRNMFTWNYIFTRAGSISTWGDYAAQVLHAHKAAVLYSTINADGSATVAKALQESLRSVGIPSVMIDVEPPLGQPDDIAAEIRDSGADLMTGFLDGTAYVLTAVAARALRPDLKILGLIGYDPGVLAVGKALAGMSIFVGYRLFEAPTPAHKRFLDAMALYAPQQQPSANEIALVGWIDTDLLIRGLQEAGPCPTRQSFMTNLRAVHDFDGGGLLPAPFDETKGFGKLNVCYAFAQISPDGSRFVAVPNKPFCGHALD